MSLLKQLIKCKSIFSIEDNKSIISSSLTRKTSWLTADALLTAVPSTHKIMIRNSNLAICAAVYSEIILFAFDRYIKYEPVIIMENR